jgi:prolyl oligopeptidase
MKTRICLIFFSFYLLGACNFNKTPTKPALAKVDPVEDEYFGIKISDPYRYMENLRDSAVLEWIKTNADYSRTVINSITGRQKLIEKMKEFDGRRSSLVNSLAITENDRYFYLKTTPADETGKLYYRKGYEGEEVLLFDPETHGNDTTKKYVIAAIYPSIDGSKVAFEIAPNGSENSEMMIMEVETRKLYPEIIDRCWFANTSWLPDGGSFFYYRLKSVDVHDNNRLIDGKVWLHNVGSDVGTDREILSRENNPELGIKPEEIPIVIYDNDSKIIYGAILTVDNRLNVVYVPYAEFRNEKISWRRLFRLEDEVYDFRTSDKDIYVYSPKGAPHFRILIMPLKNPDISKAEVLIPENPNGKITSYGITSDGFYYSIAENGVSVRTFFLPSGEKTAKELSLPFAAGSATITTKGYKFGDIWVNLAGWTSLNQRFRYMPAKDEFMRETLSALAEYPEYDDLKVEELMITSHDGVIVPLSLIYKNNLLKDGTNPVFMNGYGAYGAPMNPSFNTNLLLWTLNGGIVAVAHVRGGGELGEQWYRAGFKTTKPNTWKDLIACAEYLVKENYTSPKKIVINSGSAGGILVGRAMTERPDLFAVAIPEVGAMNTVRLEEEPSGPSNVPEFGTVRDSVEFMALLEMDSYHHISDGVKYPATLVTAGMNDPRVIAWQPAKFAARLQAANASDKPVLFLTDYEAGHGIGDTKTKQFESTADILSFALWQTGHPNFQTK